MLEVLRSRPALARPAGRRSSRPAFAARVGAPHASAVSSGTAALHLALRAVGVADGDEVVTSPFSFVASANAILYERATPVFVRHRPAHAEPRPGRRGGGDHAAARAALLPVHIFGYPADVPALERHGLPIVEDACEALGAVHADGTPVGGRGHPAAFGFYAEQADDHGRGRDAHAWARPSTRSASTPSATRAARRTWAGSTTTASASTTG